MNSHERLKQAVEHLQNENPDLRHQHIMKEMGYASVHYLSDVMNGTKPITPKFLGRLVRIGINKEWVSKGKGNMITDKKNMARPFSRIKDVDKAIMAVAKHLAEIEAARTKRPVADCLADILLAIL